MSERNVRYMRRSQSELDRIEDDGPELWMNDDSSTETINSLFTDNPNILYATDNSLLVASCDNLWSLYVRNLASIHVREEEIPQDARVEAVPEEAREEGGLAGIRRIFRACFCGYGKSEEN